MLNAALPFPEISICTGHGWGGNADLSKNPYVEVLTLNRHYQLDKSGTYSMIWSGNFYGQKLISNTAVLTLLPRDAAWESEKLARIREMFDEPFNSKGHFFEGCEAIRYLGTPAAALEMARRYHYREAQASCADDFRVPLVNATNRADVLHILDANLNKPDFGITPDYLRTLALISVYRAHPDWYATIVSGKAPPDSPRRNDSGPKPLHFWDLIRNATHEAELRYIQKTGNLLPSKTPLARARGIVTLLALSRSAHDPDLPPNVISIIQKELPAVI